LSRRPDRDSGVATQALRKRRASAIKGSELKLIASAAIIGESNHPVTG
jgi:hypothetical protein